jgi:hypothetical protein
MSCPSCGEHNWCGWMLYSPGEKAEPFGKCHPLVWLPMVEHMHLLSESFTDRREIGCIHCGPVTVHHGLIINECLSCGAVVT